MSTLDTLCNSLESYHKQVDVLEARILKLQKKADLYGFCLTEIVNHGEERGIAWAIETAKKVLK